METICQHVDWEEALEPGRGKLGGAEVLRHHPQRMNLVLGMTLVDLMRPWDLLAERAADDRRRNRSLQISSLLRELVAGGAPW
jgi:hypothetical protein